jgi:hypothetical protein
VYRTADGELFIGPGRVIGPDAVEPFTLVCRCGAEVLVDPVKLRRAARAGRRNYPVD